MPGVPREVIEHKLAVRPGSQPVKQKIRKQSMEGQEFIHLEIDKLLQAGFIREVQHPEWLANPVVVPKAGGKLRMCIDYTNLNKACPKDPFPLPRIDQIVDSTSGCELLSFLDAYSGFHQIRMAREDEEKTSFITPCGLYCYVNMPYGLKNALATFVRATHVVLKDHIGKTVEVYVDDIVVKSRQSDSFLRDLHDVFMSLRRFKMKFNPDKCVFGVASGKLLGFLVSHRGIKANSEKIQAIQRMQPPTRIKEVQRLIGSMAALSRFIAKLGERAFPFFKLLRKNYPFEWTDEAQKAFEDLKRYLCSPPVLVAPREDEPLFLYIAATHNVVSMVLVAERGETPQPRQAPPVRPSEDEPGPVAEQEPPTCINDEEGVDSAPAAAPEVHASEPRRV